MKDDRSIDLKQHALPKVSKWYLVRIIFYVIMLAIIGIVWYYTRGKEKPVKDAASVEEVTDVKIILSD
ncbi:MAG: hypothetical protein P8M19_03250 [Crocinitomicaceae bacterium]|nr:hypothetical protein [Crocinitomicaceae bacterium]MDG1659067.1 hypothetical protein [Crocinitomicaceae bacterium]MDG2440664.1 hypothetical protein [Crocinitomicaceae bacterium]